MILNSLKSTAKFNLKNLPLLETTITIAGFVALFILHLSGGISVEIQMWALMILIFLLGVPHGAMDFLVAEKNSTSQKKDFNIYKFVFVYMARLLIVALCWVNPILAIIIFMTCSIFHFGETDLATIGINGRGFWWSVLFSLHGALVLCIITICPIQQIVSALPNLKTLPNFVTDAFAFLYNYKFIIVSTLLSAVLLLSALLMKGNYNAVNFKMLFVYISFIVVVSILPSILGFALYFAIWHSLVSLKNIFQFSKKQDANSSKTIKRFLLFSLLSLVSVIATYYLLSNYFPATNLLSATIVILSVLTLPHLIEMHGMYKQSVKQDIL
jgi:beta-carotene 15,15'-dioxygenase